jgi:hypothetical protein
MVSYLPPGGSPAYHDYHLLNPAKKVKMHLPFLNWGMVLPDPGVKFKISDALHPHRLSNKSYLHYLLTQLGSHQNEKELAKDIEKICKWCGDYDILLVRYPKEVENIVLTATFYKFETVGTLHHYIGRFIHRPWQDLKLRWRLWRVAHKSRRSLSAKRNEWVQRGTQNQETEE